MMTPYCFGMLNKENVLLSPWYPFPCHQCWFVNIPWSSNLFEQCRQAWGVIVLFGECNVIIVYLLASWCYSFLLILYHQWDASVGVWKTAYHPLSKVKLPNREKKLQITATIQSHEPLVNDVWAVSLLLPSAQMRNSWKIRCISYDCDTTINHIITYGPNGNVFFCAMNFPISWSDSAVIAWFMSYLSFEFRL